MIDVLFFHQKVLGDRQKENLKTLLLLFSEFKSKLKLTLAKKSKLAGRNPEHK